MFVRNTMEQPNSPPLHRFTTLRQSTSKLADIQMNGTAQLLRTFPQLESIDAEEIYGSQIILAESTLKLMSGSLPKTAELGIQFELQSYYDLEEYDHFKCSTRFFEDGKPVDQVMEGPIEYDQHYKRLGNVQFGSRFWAVKVIEMARRLREAHEYRKKAQTSESQQNASSAEDAAREIEFEIRAHFLRLTALQELTAKRRETGRMVTLLLVCWRFEQSMHNNCGETTWRNVNLLPPPPPQQQQLVKDETKNGYEQLVLSLSHQDTSMALQQPFEDHHGFDLNEISAIELGGLPPNPSSTAQMYPPNEVDFTGHMQISLAPDVPMDNAASLIDPFPTATESEHAHLMYEEPQQWGQASSYSNDYFDQNNAFQMRSFDDTGVDLHGHHSTTPFDGSTGHAGTPFDGLSGNVHVVTSASFHHEGENGFDEESGAVGCVGTEQPLPSIEFIG
jgi:hypothetical protein